MQVFMQQISRLSKFAFFCFCTNISHIRNRTFIINLTPENRDHRDQNRTQNYAKSKPNNRILRSY